MAWFVLIYHICRYASLFFVAGINQDDNELITLEVVHRYVEILDRYFGNVCTLLLINTAISEQRALHFRRRWYLLTFFYNFLKKVCELDLIFNFNKVDLYNLSHALLTKKKLLNPLLSRHTLFWTNCLLLVNCKSPARNLY